MKYISKKFYADMGRKGQQMLREKMGEEAYRKSKASAGKKKKLKTETKADSSAQTPTVSSGS